MKLKVVLFSLIVFSIGYVCAQYTSGVNYIKFGGALLNGERKMLESYPPLVVYTDSTQTDSIIYKGEGKSDISLAYHVAITKNIVLGITSRFLGSEESSLKIKSYGGCVRFAFPLKLSKKPSYKFYFSEDDSEARTIFFLDYSLLTGSLFYDQFKSRYLAHQVQLGMFLRVPLFDVKFLRHLGFEVAGGISAHSLPYNESTITPLFTAGLHYHFDRKYTSIAIKKKD